jgi:hypothetical protein
VVLLPDGGFTAEEAVLLTPATGLIGSPEHGTPDKKHAASVLKARSLLQPAIKPCKRVVIRSQSISGTFCVQKVTHHGDTAGGDWYSDLEALPTT